MQSRLIDVPPRSDLHIHTYCSPDSSAAPDEVCKAALKSGLDAVGISDHAESFEPWNPDSSVRFKGRKCESAGEYVREISRVRAVYEGKLVVLTGVEIGYQSGRDDEIRDFLGRDPYDYAIGSVHTSPPVSWWDPSSAIALRDSLDLGRKALLHYYTELREAAESRLFDIIGHVDVYERYFPRQWPDVVADPVLAPVVRAAIKSIADHSRMELNLSTLNTLNDFPWSALPLLRMYREMGGKPPSLGSDAHVPQYVGKNLEKGERLARMAGFDGTADWRDIVAERRLRNER